MIDNDDANVAERRWWKRFQQQGLEENCDSGNVRFSFCGLFDSKK